MNLTPPAGLCIAGTVPPGDTTTTRCTHPGGHEGPHSWEVDDDEPVTVDSMCEWLLEAAQVLDGVLTDLHEVKRTVSADARHELLHAADHIQRAWSGALSAATALQDVRL